MENGHSIHGKLTHYRYQILFLVLIGNILLPGFFPDEFRADWITPVTNTVVMFACFLIVQKRRKIAGYVMVVGVLGVLFGWFDGTLRGIGMLIFALYIGLVTYELFSGLLKRKIIEMKEVIGALVGYMLIGYIGAMLFIVVAIGYDGAFSNVGTGREGIQDLFYFAYITMLTIGYGEITPLIPASRGVAMILGLIGQFYLVVVIATFVGKFLMNTSNSNIE